jgi:hypothetical protein
MHHGNRKQEEEIDMSEQNAVVAIYASHVEAEEALENTSERRH